MTSNHLVGADKAETLCKKTEVGKAGLRIRIRIFFFEAGSGSALES
jgi:hypothetical protein